MKETASSIDIHVYLIEQRSWSIASLMLLLSGECNGLTRPSDIQDIQNNVIDNCL